MIAALFRFANRVGYLPVVCCAIWILGSIAFKTRACHGDEIVLRNLKTLSNVTVTSLDEDGLTLADGKKIGLDSVLSATVSDQARFDQLKNDVGLDLFRIRTRIQRKDYENLQPHLDKLYPVFSKRKSSSAVIVHIGRFHDSILKGSWEDAIESHFRILTLVLNDGENKDYERILASLDYQYEKATGLSAAICPFAFDKEAVVNKWNSLLSAYRSLPDPHPTGLDLYFFLLAQSVDIQLEAKDSTNRIKLSFLEKLLLQTLSTATNPKSDAADIEGARVKLFEHDFKKEDSAVQRALYYFVDGVLEIKSEKGHYNEGVLSLLRIHAELGKNAEEISAAALFEVYQALKEKEPQKDAKSVANELLSRYPSSIFAKQLRMKGTE